MDNGSIADSVATNISASEISKQSARIEFTHADENNANTPGIFWI